MKTKKRLPFWWLLVVGMIFLVGNSIWRSELEGREQMKREAFAKLKSQYFDLHRGDSWWLQTPPAPDAGLKKATQAIQKVLHHSIESGRETNDQTRQIAKKFSSFKVSYEVGGSSSIPLDATDLQKPQVGLEICYFSRAAADQQPASLYFKKEWPAVMVAAVGWPETVFTATMYHELGHALKDAEGATSATAAPGSDEYVLEEVEMHGLEAEVLNFQAKGKYFMLLDEILLRPGINSFKDAYSAITIDDLKKLDEMLGCKDARGKEVTSTMLAEHLTALGIRFIEIAVPKAKRPNEYAALYRELSTQ